MKTEDGRSCFYQWDVGQRIVIEDCPAGTEMHFALKPRSTFDAIKCQSQTALVVESYEENGNVYADVPNLLLQTAGTLYVYIYPSEGDRAHTEREESFRIAPRPRPADYVYTEDEIKRWATLEKTISENSKAIQEMGGDVQELNDKITASEAEIAQNSAAIADLLYKPMEITSLSNNIGTAEMGATVNAVTLTWALNKTPVSQTAEGKAVDASARSVTLSDLGLTANATFTVTATDERETVAKKTTSITFLNGVYYGAAENPAQINSAFVLGLTKVLRSSKLPSFNANAGEGRYIWYCVPVRLGTCAFTVGGFEGGFHLAATFEFENASGYKENYYVYRSANAGLGETTVGVK